MSGVFKYPSTLKPEAYQRLKKDLLAQSVGLHNAHVPLLLEGGMTYERISIPSEDAQFIATRKFQKTEIATIYGIPPHMIADFEWATNNNIEHQGMEFVQYCLMLYLVRIEEEFNRKLLREEELLPLRLERVVTRRCQDLFGILQEHEYRRSDIGQRDPRSGGHEHL